MFVPPHQSMTAELAKLPPGPGPGLVVIPRQLLDFFLRCLLALSEIDVAEYSEAHPEVAQAIETGQSANALEHYLQTGYFTHMIKGTMEFDEEWYLKSNADVAVAVLEGKYPSGLDHYLRYGFSEWRVPNAKYRADIEIWRTLLSWHPDQEFNHPPHLI